MDVQTSAPGFACGDEVQQVAPAGLASCLNGLLFVRAVVGNELELSLSSDGPLLADCKGNPRRFPACKFRKMTKAA